MRYVGKDEKSKLHKTVVREVEAKRPLGRQRRRWENVKMEFRKIGYNSKVKLYLCAIS
jgi:hypothetical protein